MSQTRSMYKSARSTSRPSFLSFALTIGSFVALQGCGQDAPKYEPKPATDVKVSLPSVPSVPDNKVKEGDAYTVWGASYSQRNRVHKKEVLDKKISIIGYITGNNFDSIPKSCIHKTGKGDDEDCSSPVLRFWIADSKDAEKTERLPVLGWASNPANVYDAIKEIDKKGEEAEVSDKNWGNPIPNPLPSAGAKVKVTGVYSTNFTRSSDGLVADPIMGVLDLQEIEYLEPAPELATLPGVKRKPRK